MASPNSNSSSILPKITKKLAIRTLCLVVIVGGLIYGLEWFLGVRKDLKGLVKSDTVGWISAIQYQKDGRQAVLISPDGKIHKDAGYQAKATDRDLAWAPHGNFLYFISDRAEHNYNLFRWAPSSDEAAEQRTTGTRARSNPKFPRETIEEGDDVAKPLITCGGIIQQFDPKNQTTEQILPPTQKEIAETKGTGEEGASGIDSQFAGVYGNLGTSFREAQWCGKNKYIIGIMRRDNGEVLVLQDMQPVDGKFPQPKALTAGEHVDFDVNPKDGNIVYTVQHFMWPEKPPMDEKGQLVKKPFQNAAVIFDLQDGKGSVIAANDATGFGSPTIKPDGTLVAMVLGTVDNGALTPKGLVTFPTVQDPAFKQMRIPGEIYEPSWSPDGVHLVFALRGKDGKRSIFDLRTDDGTMRNVTGDSGGDFAFPRFSPQIKG